MLSYLRALIDFVAAYPDVAYGLVFLAALSEALPVVGVFVPGSLIILAVSALVPTAAVALWPLLGWATIGAVVGDGSSYWLGHRYKREILLRWPFGRYPQVAAQSEAFFHRHGGKSVFLGRFIPALRAFVPLFAGILDMPARRFYISNVLSALAWAPAHVFPGVILGASLALAGAVAGRLAVFALTLVTLLWIVAWVVRYSIRRGPSLLIAVEARLRLWAARRDTWMRRQLLSLIDPAQKEAKALALAGVVLVGATWMFLGLLEDVVSGDPLVRADTAVYTLLQGLRTSPGDAVMVAVTELGDSSVVFAVAVAVFLWLAWQRAWRTAGYWVAAVALASVFNTAIKLALSRSRPLEDLYTGWSAFSFPSGHVTVNAVMYGFLVFLVARDLRLAWRVPLIVGVAALITLIAFSRLYLGAHWFSDVAAGLAFGTAWITVLAVAHLHHHPQRIRPHGLLIVACAALAVAGTTNIYARNEADKERYAVREKVRTLTGSDWSARDWQDLPAHRIDLGGELEEPITIQWVGDLSPLQDRLLRVAWRMPESWTAKATVAWLTPDPDPLTLPVVPLLHDGRAPALTLAYAQPNGSRLVLRLWATAVEVTDDRTPPKPLWVGAVVEERLHRLFSFVTISTAASNANKPREILINSIGDGRLVRRDNELPTDSWDGRVLLVR
jgi:membrane protein DedA with SNARE-associated domain/membrane-associated phospholipid phosphatase